MFSRRDLSIEIEWKTIHSPMSLSGLEQDLHIPENIGPEKLRLQSADISSSMLKNVRNPSQEDKSATLSC